jgi:peptidoglycan hydrolase-like protein with peptidoglycan-binding domain
MRVMAPSTRTGAPPSGHRRPAAAPSPLLAMQRSAGNRAATAMVQRACCAGCGSGGACESERDDTAGAPAVQRLVDKPTLRKGSQGDPVTELQTGLNQLTTGLLAPDGLLGQATGGQLTPDGVFGPATDAAVRTFQGAQGLPADGIVGPQTWNAFQGGGGTAPAAPAKNTDPADDLRIKGLPEDRLEHPESIFFNFAESTVPPEEEGKLDMLAVDPQALLLEGTSSEEGQGNEALTNARLGSVNQGLAARQHQGGRTVRNSTSKASGQIDYRSARKVQVTSASAPRPLDDCPTSGSIVACPPTLDSSFDDASGLLGQAVGKLSSPGSLSPAERALVKDLFKDDSDGGIATVAGHMGDLRQHVIDMKATRQQPKEEDPKGKPFHRCENKCNASCSAGAFAFNSGVASTSKTVFCDGFTGMTSPPPGTGTTVQEGQAHVLIHEAAHGTPVIDCQDFAKGTERAFGLLTRDQALHNADSFTALARNLVNPNSARTTVIHSDTGDAAGDPAVQDALAFLDRWLEAADFDTSGLYGNLVNLEGTRWSDLEQTDGTIQVTNTMRLVSEEFPVTPPPGAPTKRDREVVAAVNDRYDRVRKVLKTNTSSLNVTTGPVLAWEAGPGRSVTIPPGFSSLPPRVRIEQLLAALLRAYTEVRETEEGKYARLAPKLCNNRTPGFAHSAD